METEDVRDARIELNWRVDMICAPGTNKLRSLNPQTNSVTIEAIKGAAK